MKKDVQTPVPPLLRSKAWICAAINQLAFPGMGTVMAGRRVGYVQATLMVAGFILLVGFMIWYFSCMFRYQMDEISKAEFTAAYQRYGWAGWWGLWLSLASWCWSLVSSVQILRASRPMQQPPKL